MQDHIKAFELLERLKDRTISVEEYYVAHTENKLLFGVPNLRGYLQYAQFLICGGAAGEKAINDFYDVVVRGVDAYLLDVLSMPPREKLARWKLDPLELLRAKLFNRDAKATSFKFSTTLDGRAQAESSIKALIKCGMNVTGIDAEGNKLNFFVGDCGTVAIGKKRGYALLGSDTYVRQINVLPMMTLEERRLQGIQDSLKITSKYIRRASRESKLDLAFAADCRKANEWLTPSAAGIACGNQKDGDVITLNNVLSKLPSYEHKSFLTALNTGEKYRSDTFKFGSYDGRVEVYKTGDKVNVMLATEFKGTSNGHYYLMVNDSDFMFYTTD